MVIDYNQNTNICGDYLIYFYASWSNNCNMYLEALNRIDKENKEFNILKINTTKYNDFKRKYKINKIPTYIMIKNNEIEARLDGYIDSHTLSKWVKRHR